jgi:hypothetical protein
LRAVEVFKRVFRGYDELKVRNNSLLNTRMSMTRLRWDGMTLASGISAGRS